MLLMLMITSKGMAGVPRASLVVIAATLAHVQYSRSGPAADPRGRPFPRHGPLGDQRRRQCRRVGSRRRVGRRTRRRGARGYRAATRSVAREADRADRRPLLRSGCAPNPRGRRKYDGAAVEVSFDYTAHSLQCIISVFFRQSLKQSRCRPDVCHERRGVLDRAFPLSHQVAERHRLALRVPPTGGVEKGMHIARIGKGEAAEIRPGGGTALPATADASSEAQGFRSHP